MEFLVLRVRVEPVNFYPIPARNLDELIGTLDLGAKCQTEVDERSGARLNATFDIKSAERFSGHLRIDLSPDSIIGQGAFKTAQAVQLTLAPLRTLGLGSVPNHAVAAKWPYINMDAASLGPPYLRLHVGDETKRLYREADILYWAMALLNMVYTFIDGSVAEAKELPPFDIPRLRFVEAGLLLAYAERLGAPQGPGRPKPGTVGTVYLVEEVITG